MRKGSRVSLAWKWSGGDLRTSLWLMAISLFGLFRSTSAQDSIPLTYVAIPEATLSSWQNADGVLGRRLVERFDKEGAIVRPSELPPEAHKVLAGWSAAVRHGIVYASAGNAPRTFERLLLLGPSDDPVTMRWIGMNTSQESSLLESLLPGHQAWLYEPNTLRWEEVGEFLDLTREENTALRRLEDPAHPLWMLRESFANDKRRSNLALYLLRRGDPAALGLQLDLAAAYEKPVREFWTELLSDELPVVLASESGDLAGADLDVRIAGERRLFARRVQGSQGRVYGRLDRILQSLHGELSKDGILIIDARASSDPFVASIGGNGSTDWWHRIPAAP